MKKTLLAGTLALVTGCNSLYDLIIYGSSGEPRPNPEAFAAWQQDHQAREAGEDIAENVVFAAQIAIAREVLSGFAYPDYLLPCAALALGNNPEAAYCYFVAKEGAVTARAVRRTAFPDDFYQAIAQQAEDAATEVRESFLRFIIENFGNERRRRNLHRFGVEFYSGWYYLLFGDELP